LPRDVLATKSMPMGKTIVGLRKKTKTSTTVLDGKSSSPTIKKGSVQDTWWLTGVSSWSVKLRMASTGAGHLRKELQGHFSDGHQSQTLTTDFIENDAVLNSLTGQKEARVVDKNENADGEGHAAKRTHSVTTLEIGNISEGKQGKDAKKRKEGHESKTNGKELRLVAQEHSPHDGRHEMVTKNHPEKDVRQNECAGGEGFNFFDATKPTSPFWKD